MKESIEILSVSLLNQNRQMVKTLKRLATRLGIEFGWHYLLDLIWVVRHLDQISNKRILDAGAGIGILQWYLVGEGADVISVDRMCRANLPLHFRIHYPVQGMRKSDLKPSLKSILTETGQNKRRVWKVFRTIWDLLKAGIPKKSSGRLLLYNQDLQNLADIRDNSIDTIVSISAIEHNHRDHMGGVVSELMRTLKPGGKLLATINAAKERDWYHQPSQGWCLCEESLREIFNLSNQAPANFNQYDDLFSSLCQCSELRRNLAKFYGRSGDNGMPWGVWEPQYIPVGVLKVKD